MAYSWAEVHRIAMLEASRAHHHLGIDRSRRIDPFAALETSGILVMRQALDRLAGVYLPAEPPGDGRPGVLINVNHPLSKQRYTAAHELSHHRRDHQVAIDLETEWIARGAAPTSDRERIAEAFAAWFLMPKQLIDTILSDRGLRPDLMSPQDAYELALDLGTSYEATVRHLVDARILAATHRDRLLKVPPQAIKQTLGAADVMTDSWRDVWLVLSSGTASKLDVQEGDAVVVEVPETPSSGYLWQPTAVSEGVSLVRDEYRGLEPQHRLGSRGAHRFLFRVETAGRRDVRLELRRPWQRSVSPSAERVLEIAAAPKPTAGVINQHWLVAVPASG
jgi:Zn-dependent peptidase ImmA (M78 family)